MAIPRGGGVTESISVKHNLGCSFGAAFSRLSDTILHFDLLWVPRCITLTLRTTNRWVLRVTRHVALVAVSETGVPPLKTPQPTLFVWRPSDSSNNSSKKRDDLRYTI